MNQRWQEFFSERERYTQSLEQKVQELDKRLTEAMRNGSTQEINRRIELVLEKAQKEIGQVEEMRKRVRSWSSFCATSMFLEFTKKHIQLARIYPHICIYTHNLVTHTHLFFPHEELQLAFAG